MFKTGDHLLQRLQATQAQQAARQEQRPSQYSLQVEVASERPMVKVAGHLASRRPAQLGAACSVRGAPGQAPCLHLAWHTSCCQAVHWAAEMARVRELATRCMLPCTCLFVCTDHMCKHLYSGLRSADSRREQPVPHPTPDAPLASSAVLVLTRSVPLRLQELPLSSIKDLSRGSAMMVCIRFEEVVSRGAGAAVALFSNAVIREMYKTRILAVKVGARPLGWA